MHFLTAVLFLAAAMPVYAQTASYSLQPTVRLLDLDYSGNRGLVQEYDGRQYDGGEVDLQFNTVGNSKYLDIVLNGLNSGDEDGYFDLNLGSYVSVKGKFSILTHRLGFVPNIITVSGVNTPKVYSAANTLNEGDKPALFKRVESEINANFSLPGNSDRKVTAGFWQENESGDKAIRYNNKINRGSVDRQTTDLSLGVNSGLGEGAISVDYTQRLFEDASVQNWATAYKDMPTAPRQKMNLQDLRYRNAAGAKVPVTLALSARNRTNSHNQYTGSAHSAIVGAAYKPNKKTYITAKAYARVAGVYENQSFVDGFGKAWGASGGPEAEINRSNLAADLKGRYNYSDKLSFNAGYKYENNYRRNAPVEEFAASTQPWSDGTAHIAQTNAVAVQDTRHILTAGLDAALPYDSDLSVGYTKLLANHAVFESMPTDSDQISASLVVPLPLKLTLMTSAEYVAEENKKSDHTDTTMYQNSYRAGLEWSGSSEVSTGVDYSYDQSSYRGTGYIGADNTTYNGKWVVNLLRVPGMLYYYENNVYGYHAMVKLAKGFSLTGRGSYTMSRGGIPVNLTALKDAPLVVNNLAPSDIRIASGGVTLKYMRGGSRDLTASVGYRRDQWIDKVTSANSGWANVINLTASAKF